jgi:hypothetical protein
VALAQMIAPIAWYVAGGDIHEMSCVLVEQWYVGVAHSDARCPAAPSNAGRKS